MDRAVVCGEAEVTGALVAGEVVVFGDAEVTTEALVVGRVVFGVEVTANLVAVEVS